MHLLALDTATEFCSVAYSDGQRIISRGQEAPRQHADLILPFVRDVLQEAGITLEQLDGIVLGRGPGSFTGVRIAASIGQGLAFSKNLPVVGVSSLQAMAQRAYRLCAAEQVAAAIDARMGEVYWGTYHCVSGLMVARHEERVCTPETVQMDVEGQQAEGTWCRVGTGWQTYAAALEAALPGPRWQDGGVWFPHAEDMLTHGRAQFEAGQGIAATAFEVHYVRNEVTWQKLPGRD
ncbi:tRNA (adenosine(37)-N6)-threonylcarbamoyltransferase complex dimerization subunit type 1 TsaB [Aliidiomarina celeris]|uniref:tRNA (adenosine(37)-N6)-threonylcarbamoyltransferase complex dimerization subunit type 1 TsaB n=1 Tax=Aliidiomarina celeris TaxID=2249428 RepID=UPI000DE87337|nr:tRNA (adenosine(37)-N6)-threonylcarbamoyltransferase complex dimerization subunit type 1 TsaB [Aliidiomarina celeris]